MYSVRFDLVDKQQGKGYAEYDRFWIDDEPNKYELHISDYSGIIGNTIYHKFVFLSFISFAILYNLLQFVKFRCAIISFFIYKANINHILIIKNTH